ncbi:hypothetical protein D9M69_714470 [compost metagenome]
MPARVVDGDETVGVGDAEVLELAGGAAEGVVGGRSGDDLHDHLGSGDAQPGRSLGEVVGAVVRLAQRAHELVVSDSLHVILRVCGATSSMSRCHGA